MRSSITIDAGVLAMRNIPCGLDEAEKYVETLLDWAKLVDESWINVYMSQRAAAALFDDDLYPSNHQLARLLRTSGVVGYDGNTVAMLADRLLRITPSFEERFFISDVLAESYSTSPAVLNTCRGPALLSELERCMLSTAILRKYCSNIIGTHYLLLGDANAKIIALRALITILEYDTTAMQISFSIPQQFEGDVLVCDDIKSFLESIDEVAILLEAEDMATIERVVRIAVYKSSLDCGRETNCLEEMFCRIGHKFHSIFLEIHPTKQLASKILRSIVETVEQRNLAAVHALRIGAGATDSQRIRTNDQAKAWRRDIDDEFHLHYWRCPDGTFEIASLGVHNDFTIPE